MLKFENTQVVFSEVPNEVTLAINITNCPCKCEGCHSPQLSEDIGDILDRDALDKLIHENDGITCISFMGGDADPSSVNELARYVMSKHLLVAWYSGRDTLPIEIQLENFHFIKLGHYDKNLGPLTSRTTNQKFYEVELGREIDVLGNPTYILNDITKTFWK